MKKNSRVFRFGAPTLAVVTCISAVLVSYCGTKEEKKVEAKFSSIYANALTGCATCHKPGTEVYTNKVKNLDMSSQAAAYTSLMLTMEAPTQKPLCSDNKFVKAGDASNSILVAVFDESVRTAFPANNSGCAPIAASEMGAGAVSAETLAAVKQWINEGAANN